MYTVETNHGTFFVSSLYEAMRKVKAIAYKGRRVEFFGKYVGTDTDCHDLFLIEYVDDIKKINLGSETFRVIEGDYR